MGFRIARFCDEEIRASRQMTRRKASQQAYRGILPSLRADVEKIPQLPSQKLVRGSLVTQGPTWRRHSAGAGVRFAMPKNSERERNMMRDCSCVNRRRNKLAMELAADL
jgi:hypothetical protein